MNIPVLVIGACLFIPFAAGAEVYKWVDEDGRTHYGEKPEAADASKIEIREPPRTDESVIRRNEKRDQYLDILEEERAQDDELKQQEITEQQTLSRHCTELKDYLKKLQEGRTHYYQLDNEGNRIYMSEQEIASEKDKLEKEYRKSCS